MDCKSILCAYSGEKARGSGLRHAIKLAKHHGAHLTSVLWHGVPTLEKRYSAHLPDAVLEQLRDADRQHIVEISERFREAVAAAGIEAESEFVEIDASHDGSLAEFSHSFDLIVTGVHTDVANEEHLSAYPDLLALKSGRPVVVVPDGYDGDGLADKALVAWDGKRASARAIGDAMLVLAKKTSVTLLSVGATPRGTERMVQNMRRHGVDVAAKTVKRSGSIAETILAEAKTADARLIVMGAFEHSKFSHDLFGGVTTDVIAKTSVPVFMAH